MNKRVKEYILYWLINQKISIENNQKANEIANPDDPEIKNALQTDDYYQNILSVITRLQECKGTVSLTVSQWDWLAKYAKRVIEQTKLQAHSENITDNEMNFAKDTLLKWSEISEYVETNYFKVA